MVDMPDYAHPYMPDMLRNALAANQLQSFYNKQQLQGDMQSAGQTAATGDYTGAQNQLFSQGHMAEAVQMRNLIRQAKQDQLSDLKDTYEKSANVALAYKDNPNRTPEMWGQYIDAAKSHGLDMESFRDPDTGPDMVIAMANKRTEQVKEEQDRRNAELARMKGATMFKGPGEDTLTPYYPATTQFGAPVKVPEGVDLGDKVDLSAPGGKDKSTELERVATDYQNAWKEAHPDDQELPRDVALNAAGIQKSNRSGTKVELELGPDGKPQIKTSGFEGTTGYAKTSEGAYNLKLNQGVASADATIAARGQLGQVVDTHATQLDKIANRPDFNKAMMFLKSPDGLRFWSGQAVDLGKVPQTAIDLRMTIKSLEHEYGNFVAAGHKGAMSEHEGTDLKNIVGQLNTAPDSDTFRHAVGTLKDLSNAFRTITPIGPQAPRHAGTTQNPFTSGAVAPKQAHEMSDDELKAMFGVH